ncbi:MAG TPA: hypothetical protein VGL53_07515 [Bryobacteraceae bacterium]
MDIDEKDGTVTLSNGLVIRPDLTRGEFEAVSTGGSASGSPPWSHHRIAGDVADGREILASVCFHGELLVSVDLCAGLYPAGQVGWEHYSDEIEAATKDFHDHLLEHLFSKHLTAKTFEAPGELSRDPALLKRTVEWKFAWGSVVSHHDPRSSTTSITVLYGNRLAEA